MGTVTRALLLLCLAAPVIGQNEDEPYFSLSSTRTFASRGKPTVALSAWNVSSLEIRVYRVHDAVKFFQQLDSAHQFGGQVPRPPREKTLLERIHDFKRGLRRDVRLSLRRQFTESPTAHLESVLPKKAQQELGGKTQYAEAPVLNPSQLVTSFVQPVHSANRWDSETVDIGVKEKGVYLVEAVHKEMRAYTILMVSDIVMLTKAGRGRLVNFVADRASGAPVSDAEVWMVTK